jgi:hypothetical protein
MQTNADAREGQPDESAGEPAMRAGRPDWSSAALDRFEPPRRVGVSKAVFGLVVAGAALTAIGLAWTMKPDPAPANAAPRSPSGGFLGEYVEQGRQGVDMAREVQGLRREHMEGVQRAIEGGLSEHMPGRKP